MRLEKTPYSNLFNTNNWGRCSQMYPWWPPWLPDYPHIREDGPECLTLCLPNVSEMYFCPCSFHKEGHLPRSMCFSILGVVCSASVWVIYGLGFGVGAGSQCLCWLTALWLQCYGQRCSPSAPKALFHNILNGGEILNHTRGHENR